MIIWLASYPKSGNTWVRLFLDSLLFKQDGSVNINDIGIKQFPLRGDKERGNSADLMTIISSWGNHYSSWKRFKKNNLLIKYEDLINKPEEEFLKLCNFVERISNFKFKKNLILKAVENCEFDKLNRQEESSGFREGAENIIGKNNKFFYLGPKNDWKKLLSKKIRNEIEIIFKKEMLEVGYL